MMPVSPVIPTVEVKEVIIAERQDEYLNLPSIILEGGFILTRWKLNDDERETVAQTGDIYLYQQTGGRYVTPMMLQVETPVLPDAPEFRDEIIQSEYLEPSVCHSKREVNTQEKPKFRIRCLFDAAPFAWGMEDGVFSGQSENQIVIEKAAPGIAAELLSEKYPGYLKSDEHHFKGGGIAHSGFDPYLETHKGKAAVDQNTVIVANPMGEREVYDREVFHEIYSLEKS